MNFEIHIIPDWLNFGVQIAATIILFLVIRQKLFKPVNALLEKRRNYIESNISNSEKLRQEADEMKKKYDSRLQEAKMEASQIISEAKKYGEDIKNKAVKDSKELAKQEYDKGVKNLEQERQKVMDSLNDEIVDMAMLACEKVLMEKVDEKVDKKFIEILKKDLEQSHE